MNYYLQMYVNQIIIGDLNSRNITRFNESEAVSLAGPKIYFLISELQIQFLSYVYWSIPRSLKRGAIQQTLPMIHRYSEHGSTGLAAGAVHLNKRERRREDRWNTLFELINLFPI